MKKFYRLSNDSFKEYKVKTHRGLWKKAQEAGYAGFSAECVTLFKDLGDNRVSAVFSTATEDRHGDIVEQNWDLKNYKKNPVYLDSHNYGSIEHIIGKVEKIKIKDGKLQGEIVFNMDNPKGILAYKMAKNGFLNTSSVGFIPKEFDNSGKILKSELLENSAVSVPANAEALYEKITDKKYGEGETIENDDKNKNIKKTTPKGNSKGSKTNGKKDKQNTNDSKKELEHKQGVQGEVKTEKQIEAEQHAEQIMKQEPTKAQTLSKLARITDELREKIGRNSEQSDRAEINKSVNRAIRNLIKLKE